MKILFIFLIACGAALGADLLLGKWKEDENKRQNLSKFLKARGKSFIFPSQLYYYRRSPHSTVLPPNSRPPNSLSSQIHGFVSTLNSRFFLIIL